MFSNSSLVAWTLPLFLAGVTALFVLRKLLKSHLAFPLPAGPRGLPIIGNALDWPTSQEWETFAKWGRKWGTITYVNILGSHIVVLNSLQTATEMLDGKSSIYSDRPSLVMAGPLAGWSNILHLTPYGDTFRQRRKMLHQFMGTRTIVERYYPVEELETRRFLLRLLENPEDFAAHIRRAEAAIVLKLTYGYDVKDHDDPVLTNTYPATTQFSLVTIPGAYLVDLLPSLRYLPSWLPGMQWKRSVADYAEKSQTLANVPFTFAKQHLISGFAKPSFVTLSLPSGIGDEEANLKWAAASIHVGGSSTPVSAITSFFLAMALYPDVQKQAQAELDAIVGSSRLPSYSDREKLPYVDALVKEVLRWNPIVPTGVPHLLMQDDIHDGYLIPKGTIVIANIWNFLHDETTFKNPMEFDPSRFIATKDHTPERDPHTIAFGFGRRTCPAMNLADASVFISCAMTLAAFNISKTVENGIVVEPVHESYSGTISFPKPFKCSIRPRSEDAVALINLVDMQNA
ncbi:cytochrome P450 [Artomyces pyxidatus]|uniref:Cytochrome P450 n=1 Tax=Artomyces pyxidatus TaxID=48021 RepID=A0ACB8TLG1_9AGAM|nr:cytochrome P450 [Artomyces pyxidatus]